MGAPYFRLFDLIDGEGDDELPSFDAPDGNEVPVAPPRAPEDHTPSPETP